MIRFRGLAYFLGFWGIVGLLIYLGGSGGADSILILAFFGLLLVGSLVAISRGWLRKRGTGRLFYTGNMIPESWARWAMDEPNRPPSP